AWRAGSRRLDLHTDGRAILDGVAMEWTVRRGQLLLRIGDGGVLPVDFRLADDRLHLALPGTQQPLDFVRERSAGADGVAKDVNELGTELEAPPRPSSRAAAAEPAAKSPACAGAPATLADHLAQLVILCRRFDAEPLILTYPFAASSIEAAQREIAEELHARC